MEEGSEKGEPSEEEEPREEGDPRDELATVDAHKTQTLEAFSLRSFPPSISQYIEDLACIFCPRSDFPQGISRFPLHVPPRSNSCFLGLNLYFSM